MKTICVVFMILPLLTSAQREPVHQLNGWRIDNSRSLLWQHIEEDSTVTAFGVIETLRSYSWITEVEQYGSTIFAIANDYHVDEEKYGRSSVWPFMYQDATWDMAIRIDLKPNRYRITVSDLSFDEGEKKNIHDKVQRVVSPLDELVLTRDRMFIRPSYFSALEFFEQVLLDTFKMGSRTPAEEW